MGLIDFIFIICLNELFPNQNEKVLKEALAGSNSDAVETTLRCLRYFKITLRPHIQDGRLPIQGAGLG